MSQDQQLQQMIAQTQAQQQFQVRLACIFMNIDFKTEVILKTEVISS